jgi:hypothetical protein
VAQMLAEIAARTYAMEAVSDLVSLLADAGRSDIRLEAAVAKLWNTESAWRACDLALQVRGGRGYETARSLAARGEAAIPLERLLRDLRVNRIFEGTSQIMRLFIAREALDLHLRAAGDVVLPGVPAGRRLAGLAKAATFYSVWYPLRWLGWGRWPQYAEFGPLAGHLRWVERSSRRLARRQFHLMVRHGAGLEKRQAQLFRCVDIGAELFAASATCVRAHDETRRNPADRTPLDLAGLFCLQARRRVEALFGEIASNDDPETYRVARAVLDGKYGWLERGIVEPASVPPAGPRRRPEAGS